MLQTIVVWIVVGLAAIYVVRRYLRSLTGKDHGCDCGTTSCGSCSNPEGGPLRDFPRPKKRPDEE